MGFQIFPIPSSGGNSNLTTSDLATYSSSVTRLNKLTITNTQAVNSVPNTVNMVYALIAGGGGGGKGGSQNSYVSNGGGGAGGVAFGLVPYIANKTATVGAGGSAGNNNPNGNPGSGGTGGTSSYMGIVANGGSGGAFTNNIIVNDGNGSNGSYGQIWTEFNPVSTSSTWGSDGGRALSGRATGRGGNAIHPSSTGAAWPTAINGADGLYAPGAGAVGNYNSTNVANSSVGGGGGGIAGAGNAASINAAGNGGTGGGGGGSGTTTGRDLFNGGTNGSSNYAPGGNGGSGAVIIYY